MKEHRPVNRQPGRRKPSPEQRKRERRRKVRRNRILFLIILCFLGFGIYHMTDPDIFTVKRIIIRGNEQVGSSTIQEAAGLKKGSPVFRPGKNTIIKRLEKIPYVDTAKVNRNPMGKVELTVTERIPVAQIYYDEWYYLLDKELRLLEKTREFHPDMIKITGLNMKGAKPGQYLFLNEKQKRQRELFRFMMDSELAEMIQSVEISENSCNFVSKDDIKIIFGSFANGKYKAKQLIEVLKKVETMDKKVLMILMEKGEDPIAVTEGSGDKKPDLVPPEENDQKDFPD